MVLDAYSMLGSCAADRPRGCLGVTLAAAAASAFASTHAAACSLSYSMLGSCAADRPCGCVTLAAAAASAFAPTHAAALARSHAWAAYAGARCLLARMLGWRTLVLDAYSMLGSCAADRPRGGVTLAAAAASALASTHAAARSLSCLGGVRCAARCLLSMLGSCAADRPRGCDARRTLKGHRSPLRSCTVA